MSDSLTGAAEMPDGLGLHRRFSDVDAGASGDMHYRIIFEAAGVGIARVALDGRFLEVNNRFAEIVGRAREDLIGLNFRDIANEVASLADSGSTIRFRP